MSSVLVTASSVIEFIKSFGVSRDSFQASGSSGLMEVARTLRKYADESKAYEQAILAKFQVADVNELQTKIDTIASNFSAFQSLAIRNDMRSFRETYENTLTAAQLNEGLIGYISGTPEGQAILEAIEDEESERVSDLAIEKLTAFLMQSVETARLNTSQKGVKKSYFSKYVKDFAQYIKDRKKAAAFSRQYKKDLKLVVVQQDGDSSGNSSWEIRGELEKNSDRPSLNFYPYFNLTEEQKKEALHDTHTWNNFIKNLCGLVPGEYQYYMDTALRHFTVEDFFQYDMNGVVGILGEVQALAILLALLPNDKQACFRAVGNLKNELTTNLAKVGTDIIIDEIYGIQVKNYQGYPVSGGTKGYHLSRTLTASELIDRLTTSQKVNLENYMAILSYNKPFKDVGFLKEKGWYDKESLDQYASYYHSLAAKRGSVQSTVKAMILTDINKFWTFQEAFRATISETDPKLFGDYKNVFWFFGGKKIIASSQIFNLLASRVEQLSEKLQNADKAVLDNFYTTYRDNNSLIWRPEKNVDGELYGPENISVRDILANITVALTLNIYLEDIENFG